jgi:hypothetical protein
VALVTTNLRVDQGVDFEQIWRWGTLDEDTQITDYIDLTGWTVLSQVRSTPGPSGYLLVASVDVDISQTLGLGYVVLSIPGNTSWGWTWAGRRGVYDVVLYDALGVPQERFAEGYIDLRPGVSHA